MSQNHCDRCGRPIKDPNAKYGWRCAEIVAAGGSLIIDLSAIRSKLENNTDFSFDSQRELLEVFKIFDKMLTFASSPVTTRTERDYVEKGAGLAHAMFSNYEQLGSKAKQAAVSYFLEEMREAGAALPPPSPERTLSERLNGELLNYDAAEYPSDTKDTVEDSFDALFGNIPFYNYLGAILARTKAERKHHAIKGILGSLAAIESLPYTSSMIGDIAVVPPHGAMFPKPFEPSPKNAGKGLEVIDGKVGGKISVDDYNVILNRSVKNSTSNTLTLGKYSTDATSYTKRAGATSYFDMGDAWNLVKRKYDLTDAEMFDYFNKPVLNDAISKGKAIRFSHNPLEHRTGAFAQEWEFIKATLGKSDAELFFEGGFWYVK